MTRCEFFLNEGVFEGFKITGHVGIDVKGKDVVCAAISALSQSTLIGLKEVMHLNVDYRLKDGLLECNLREKNECAQTMLKTLYETLFQLSRQYPKNVSVRETEVKK